MAKRMMHVVMPVLWGGMLLICGWTRAQAGQGESGTAAFKKAQEEALENLGTLQEVVEGFKEPAGGHALVASFKRHRALLKWFGLEILNTFSVKALEDICLGLRSVHKDMTRSIEYRVRMLKARSPRTFSI